MKERFIKLGARLNLLGISKLLARTNNATELKEFWTFFIQTCRPIVAAANEWKRQFQADENKRVLFKSFEVIPYPTEIACLLKIMNMSEEEIFEDTDDFKAALKKEHKPFSEALAKLMDTKNIKDITAEDILR